jgi:hemolysin III
MVTAWAIADARNAGRGYRAEMTSALSKKERDLDVPLGTPTRPSWRGRSHFLALIGIGPAFIVLLVLADGAAAKTGVAIYAVGVCSMFAVSATYHRWVHTVRARQLWRRADHATIFAAIAGTYTPLCLVAMPRSWGIPMLVIVWAGGLCGAAMKLVNWRHARIVGAVLYIGLGWVGLSVVPSMLDRSGWWPVLCLLAGGLLYTIGAIGFARQWPKLRPSVFSYHEVWHLYTIAAATTQLVAVWAVVT